MLSMHGLSQGVCDSGVERGGGAGEGDELAEGRGQVVTAGTVRAECRVQAADRVGGKADQPET
ncbi:hypothetical protein [Spongiactinospora rosea]|uniref:hypothetical protein n=1 Tax=Spongiactinospora rosea TaxID=2248750 RepID=UPI0018F48E9E|nr:hypothetical protein [Spongiactinospora rosea]